VEQVAPSFFNNSRAEGYPGVVCRYNHEDAFMLGSTRGGTLKLSVDETGLLYTVDVPQCRSDVLELVTRGDVANSSFAFVVTEQEWGQSEQGYPKRTLVSGKLIDVAPVTVPAYRDTSVALRGLAEYMNIPY
jgi:HK97 family phage prohead protease